MLFRFVKHVHNILRFQAKAALKQFRPFGESAGYRIGLSSLGFKAFAAIISLVAAAPITILYIIDGNTLLHSRSNP
jgi:hypothetical protein